MVAFRIPTIALVGNPNTGKTTLFNALAGMHQRVGNYPGVTVETKKGNFNHHDLKFEVIDLPGTYSMAPRSPDEMAAVAVILGRQQGESRPDVIIAIVDASNLERNLYLVTQVMEVGAPVIVALNMMDVAKGQGLEIDAVRLAKNLGVPVVPLQANKGRGIDTLKDAVAGALAKASDGGSSAPGPPFPEPFEKEVATLAQHLGDGVPPFLVRRLLLDVGGQTEHDFAHHLTNGLGPVLVGARKRLQEAGCGVPGVEARTRYGWIRAATIDCVRRPKDRIVTWTDTLDKVLTHKVWGTLTFAVVMFVMFESIFFWAKPIMDWIALGRDELAAWVTGHMAPGALRGLVVDGVTKGVGGVLVFLPQIMILFAFIAVLEDCGYMARAAYLMDRLMSRCGLSGKSFIPLLSSVACAVPGIMAARVIENRRDRLATIMVAPLMSCSARLPVYLLLTGTFLSGYAWWVPGLALFAMYALGMVVAPLVALLLKRTLLRGETPVFVMEMPLYKRPSLRSVLRRALESGWMFVRRAGTFILATMIVVWALLYFPNTTPGAGSFEEAAAKLDNEAALNDLHSQWKRQSYLGRMGKAIEPAVRPLGWDWRIGMAALASFPAREVMVGTLGIIFSQGAGDAADADFRGQLGASLKEQRWDDDPARPLFTIPVALSVMVFFALCCQCASTLAVIRRETNSWAWPAFTFVYMTALAYVGAWLVYQVGSIIV